MTTVLDRKGDPASGPKIVRVASDVETHDVTAVNRAADRKLYASRQEDYPKLAPGRFRTIKWLVMAMTLEPPGLDPTIAPAAAIGEVVHYNIFEGLTKIAENGEVQPLLAFEPAEPDIMSRPPRPPGEPILTPEEKRRLSRRPLFRAGT